MRVLPACLTSALLATFASTALAAPAPMYLPHLRVAVTPPEAGWKATFDRPHGLDNWADGLERQDGPITADVYFGFTPRTCAEAMVDSPSGWAPGSKAIARPAFLPKRFYATVLDDSGLSPNKVPLVIAEGCHALTGKSLIVRVHIISDKPLTPSAPVLARIGRVVDAVDSAIAQGAAPATQHVTLPLAKIALDIPGTAKWSVQATEVTFKGKDELTGEPSEYTSKLDALERISPAQPKLRAAIQVFPGRYCGYSDPQWSADDSQLDLLSDEPYLLPGWEGRRPMGPDGDDRKTVFLCHAHAGKVAWVRFERDEDVYWADGEFTPVAVAVAQALDAFVEAAPK